MWINSKDAVKLFGDKFEQFMSEITGSILNYIKINGDYSPYANIYEGGKFSVVFYRKSNANEFVGNMRNFELSQFRNDCKNQVNEALMSLFDDSSEIKFKITYCSGSLGGPYQKDTMNVGVAIKEIQDNFINNYHREIY